MERKGAGEAVQLPRIWSCTRAAGVQRKEMSRMARHDAGCSGHTNFFVQEEEFLSRGTASLVDSHARRPLYSRFRNLPENMKESLPLRMMTAFTRILSHACLQVVLPVAATPTQL